MEKVYVGSAVDLCKRWQGHRRSDGEEMFVCTKCGSILSVKHYHKNKFSCYNLNPSCKNCVSGYKKKKYKERKTRKYI